MQPAVQEIELAAQEAEPAADAFVDFPLDQTIMLSDDEEDELSQAELAECTVPEGGNTVEIVEEEVMEVVTDIEPTHPETMAVSEVANIIDV